MCDCLPKMLCVYCIYIYYVNKFEARLLFLYLPLKIKIISKPKNGNIVDPMVSVLKHSRQLIAKRLSINNS